MVQDASGAAYETPEAGAADRDGDHIALPFVPNMSYAFPVRFLFIALNVCFKLEF